MCTKIHVEGRIGIKKKMEEKLNFALPYYARNFKQDRKMSEFSDYFFLIDRKAEKPTKEKWKMYMSEFSDYRFF